MFRKILKIIGWVVLALLALLAIQTARHWDTIRRVMLGGYHTHETVPPAIPADIRHPAVLVFSKTNGFRHEEAIPAANAMFDALGKEQGWSVFKTENGAAFSREILAKFDVVVFSNASGDLFNPKQQAAFKAFVENGGGYVGIHAAGDNSHEGWPWYVENVIGTHFVGHPLNPQFQQATMKAEGAGHPVAAALPPVWQRTDEWYSFTKSPRGVPGVGVLATLDESTYKPDGPFGQNLRMGADHPVIWWRCLGKGRVFYSALGHTAQSYSEPEYRAVLAKAISWAMKREGNECGAPAAANPESAK